MATIVRSESYLTGTLCGQKYPYDMVMLEERT